MDEWGSLSVWGLLCRSRKEVRWGAYLGGPTFVGNEGSEDGRKARPAIITGSSEARWRMLIGAGWGEREPKEGI